MGMFDTYNNKNLKVRPENLVEFLDVKDYEWDIIDIGATNIHYFKLPVLIEDIKDYLVSYKQGLDIVLEKTQEECELEQLGEDLYLRCILNPKESKLFNNYNKDTFIQLKLILQNDEIIYSGKYRLKVFNSINLNMFEEIE